MYKNFNDPELTLKPNLSLTLKNTKIPQYIHNGKWEFNQLEKNECWSCCMSLDQESSGCVAAHQDRLRWNLSSF
jgi:hypothetical protein